MEFGARVSGWLAQSIGDGQYSTEGQGQELRMYKRQLFMLDFTKFVSAQFGSI